MALWFKDMVHTEYKKRFTRYEFIRLTNNSDGMQPVFEQRLRYMVLFNFIESRPLIRINKAGLVEC